MGVFLGLENGGVFGARKWGCFWGVFALKKGVLRIQFIICVYLRKMFFSRYAFSENLLRGVFGVGFIGINFYIWETVWVIISSSKNQS